MLLPNGKTKNIPLNTNNPLTSTKNISSSEENRATCEYCVMQHDPRKPHITPTSDIYSTISVFQQPHLNSAISKSILFLGSSCVVMIHPPELYKGIWRVDSLTPTFCQWNHARSLYLILDGTRKTPRHFLDPKQKQTSQKVSSAGPHRVKGTKPRH